MKLTNKNITKLLDGNYRKHVLSAFNPNTPAKEKLDAEMSQYSKSLVEAQKEGRNLALADDSKSGYGLSPIAFICAIKNDGTIAKILFEMRGVNYFLKSNDISSACEVMKCILVMWMMNDKSICSFDIEKIETELKKAEAEALKMNSEDDSSKPLSAS